MLVVHHQDYVIAYFYNLDPASLTYRWVENSLEALQDADPAARRRRPPESCRVPGLSPRSTAAQPGRASSPGADVTLTSGYKYVALWLLCKKKWCVKNVAGHKPCLRILGFQVFGL